MNFYNYWKYNKWTKLLLDCVAFLLLLKFCHLVVVQSLQSSAVTLRIVDTEGRQELEHLLLHLAAVGVQGCNKTKDLEINLSWNGSARWAPWDICIDVIGREIFQQNISGRAGIFLSL